MLLLQVLAWLCLGSLGDSESGRLVSGPVTVMPNRAKVPAHPESRSQGNRSLLTCGPLHPGLGIPSMNGSLLASYLVLVPPTQPFWDPWKRGQSKGCQCFLKGLQVPPSKPSLCLVPRCWEEFFNSVIWAVAYAGHVGCVGPACSVFMFTSQGLLSDPLLCVWEFDPAGLGRGTRQWHGQQ